MTNITLKGDGTEETGEIIINILVSLGGNNLYKLSGMSDNHYFIDTNNVICYSFELPIIYKFIDIGDFIINSKNVIFYGRAIYEDGYKIFNILENLGGINKLNIHDFGGFFYYIDSNNIITYSKKIPNNYFQVDIDEYLLIKENKKVEFHNIKNIDIDSLFDDITKMENIMKNFNDDINNKISDIKKRIQKILIDKQ